MMPWLTRAHANPHSDHLHGQRAAAAIEVAREQIAELVGCNSDEVIFTSSATEANNLALQGLLAPTDRTRLLAVSAAAHKSVLEVANVLGGRGIPIIRLPVGNDAAISPEILGEFLREHGPAEVGLVSATHGNNEIGTLQELSELADIVHGYGYHLHIDAAQTVGKVPFDIARDAIDLASLSSHKMYGPAGIGALFVASNVQRRLTRLFYGGGQEQGLRLQS
jgi:cysteine desulfurase